MWFHHRTWAMNKGNFKRVWALFRDTFKAFQKDQVMLLSAAIAFYAIFSLPGIVIIVIRIASVFLGEKMVKGTLNENIGALIGPDAAQEIQKMAENSMLQQSNSLWTVIGVLLVVFSAGTVFTIIQTTLNTIWGVRSKPKRGILKLIRDRVMSFLVVVLLSVLVLISVVFDLSFAVFRELLFEIFPYNLSLVLPVISGIISFVIVGLVFGIIFKVLPDVKLEWRDVLISAVASAVLFSIGKILIGMYLAANDFSSTFGAAGSVVLILVWVNYSSMIMLFGCEFTIVYAKSKGRKIVPKADAVMIEITEIEVGKEGLLDTRS
jgi:membrane protein